MRKFQDLRPFQVFQINRSDIQLNRFFSDKCILWYLSELFEENKTHDEKQKKKIKKVSE